MNRVFYHNITVGGGSYLESSFSTQNTTSTIPTNLSSSLEFINLVGIEKRGINLLAIRYESKFKEYPHNDKLAKAADIDETLGSFWVEYLVITINSEYYFTQCGLLY